jgi:enoyl-[acyl-carrier-protein] reductase (NADH)
MGQEVLNWKIRSSGAKPEEILASTAASIPLQRNPTSDDIVNAVMFFLSDKSSFLTGSVLDVDGGMLSTMPMPGTAK